MTEQDQKNESQVDYGDEEKEGSLFRFMSALVVLVAVAGFFSLAWYAYKSGSDPIAEKDVEIVKADTTPVKEAPANPGGMDIPNQDKTVYGLVNGNKGEKPTVERILPAPEEPVIHGSDTETWMSDKAKKIASGEDVQDTKSAAAPIQEPTPAATATASAASDTKAQQFNPDKVREEAAEEKTQVAAAPTVPAAPTPAPAVVTPAPTPAPTPATPVVVADAMVAKPAPVVAAAPVTPPVPAIAPVVAPKPVPVAAPTPAKVAAQPTNDDDSDDADDDKAPAPKAAATAPKGARVQLGAYKSEDEANQGWAKVAKAFAADVQGKQHYVIRADLGDKGVFYRLQVAPFASPKEAEQFCINFVSAGRDCFLAKGK